MSTNRELRDATGEFIVSKGPYDVFATFTIGEESVGDQEAYARFSRTCKELARNRSGHVLVAWCWGYQHSGRPHFHALFRALEDDKAVQPEELQDASGWGLTEIEPCNGNGAAYYLAKKGHHWNINTACNRSRRCRRSEGCIHDIGPWPDTGALELS
ncbi:MAG: hypothetical protein M0R80_17210 [Proteobacteria bacterium]|nr:hypothetical protein [Pseudomonadota bacterium]